MKDLNLGSTKMTGKQRLSEGHFPCFKYGLRRPAAARPSFLTVFFRFFSPPTLPSSLPAIRPPPPPPHPHPHPLTPNAQANFRPPKGQRSRPTSARKKCAHTALSLSHTHAHTAPFCRCRSTCPPRPIFRNTKRRSQQQPHFHCALSSYHRY